MHTPEGLRFANFTKTFLVHTKGKWAGRPFVLEPWQVDWASELLRTDGGKRVYREALLGIARKNGKSALCSALALYALIVEGSLTEAGAEVYSAAASKQQARIVFEEAKKMVEASPLLKDWVKITRDSIYVPSTGAVYRVLAADGLKTHGLNPSFVVADELHAWKQDELWHALSTAGLAREQPLLVAITTAGFDLDTICGRIYERGASGEDGFYHCWYGVPESQLDDHEAWKLANPASWIDTEDLVRESKRHPLSVFRRLHLNVWTAAEDIWLPAGAWENCVSDERIQPGEDVWVGVDLGLTHDSTAVVEIAKRGEGYVVQAHIFATHPDKSKPAPSAHTVVPGERVSVALVENHIRDIARRQNIMEVAYDPWRFTRSAELLQDEGIPMTEFPQSNERMAPASQALFDAITGGLILHSGDEALTKHIQASTARDTGRGWRLDKKQNKSHMDASIAMAIALARAQVPEDSGFTIRFVA